MTIHMGIPQMIYVALMVFGATLHLLKHGEPRDGVYNFWVVLVADIITVGLLYWGGFFR